MQLENLLLEMKGINKSFFKVQVLKNAQIEVRPGEVHVLLGENGAGKSTLIKILSNALRRESGTIKLEGKEVNFRSPKEAIDHGISVIYQEFNLNPYFSIYENILLGKEIKKGIIIDKKKSIEYVRRYMDMIGLDVSAETLVCELSVAQKQMVEIAKALSNNLKILVLDEPTAAITDKETERLFQIVRNLKSQGIGIIYISHRISELFEIGDRCTIMRDGQYITTVELKDITVGELTKMMVGREVSLKRFENRFICDETVLSVQDLNYRALLKNISFQLRRGEILGIAGLVGAGRTELAKCIMGAYRTRGGSITVNGKALRRNRISDAINNGIVYLSEDRKDEGLILIHPMVDNVALPNLPKYGKFVLNKKKMITAAENQIEKLQIKINSPMTEVKRLSGGNQQKVVVAKWLCSDANIYIFDEPTRGIDVGARDEIYHIMMGLVEKGASIIMISSDLVEIQKMSSRILVLKEGCIVADLENNDELTQETILYYALTGGREH